MNLESIDWCEKWKDQMELHKASDGGRDCADFWAKASTAKIYAQSGQDTQAPRIARVLKDVQPTKTMRILDVGAGPGLLTIPMAQKASHVTAVEPAKAMIDRLKEYAEKEGVSNLDCIEKRWEDVHIERDLNAPYDVVVCSYALGMAHIRQAVEKMALASGSKVLIYWFAGESSWTRHYKALYPMLHGREYCPMPDTTLLMKVLEQMGIEYKVREFDYESESRFPSLDDAVGFYNYRYNVQTPEQERILREYLDRIMDTEGEERVLQIDAKSACVSFDGRSR